MRVRLGAVAMMLMFGGCKTTAWDHYMKNAVVTFSRDAFPLCKQGSYDSQLNCMPSGKNWQEARSDGVLPLTLPVVRADGFKVQSYIARSYLGKSYSRNGTGVNFSCRSVAAKDSSGNESWSDPSGDKLAAMGGDHGATGVKVEEPNEFVVIDAVEDELKLVVEEKLKAALPTLKEKYGNSVSSEFSASVAQRFSAQLKRVYTATNEARVAWVLVSFQPDQIAVKGLSCQDGQERTPIVTGVAGFYVRPVKGETNSVAESEIATAFEAAVAAELKVASVPVVVDIGLQVATETKKRVRQATKAVQFAEEFVPVWVRIETIEGEPMPSLK